MAEKSISFFRILPISRREDVIRVNVSPLLLCIEYEITRFEGERVLRVEKRVAASLLSFEIELRGEVLGYGRLNVCAPCLQIG